MPVREFRDQAGKHWRVWNIAPDSVDAQARADAYLADCFELGWIVFETVDGSEKRRLCPYPTGWEERPESGLRELLATADPVSPSRHAVERAVSLQSPPPPTNRPALAPSAPRAVPTTGNEQAVGPSVVSDLRALRSFRYPGGRLWSVRTVANTEDGGGPALRFSAGSRHIDLRDWPVDWADYSDQRLVDLLRTVRRPVGRHAETGVQGERRYTDPGRLHAGNRSLIPQV